MVVPPRPSFPTLAALHAWLQVRCRELAKTRAPPEPRERLLGDVLQEERAALRSVPVPFDGYAEQDSRVTSTSLIHYDRNRYCVESDYVGQVVPVRAYADRVVVWAEGRLIAEPDRRFGPTQVGYEPWHYLAALQVKPGALRNGAPCKAWALPKPVPSVPTHLLKQPGGDRAFVEWLLLARQTDLDTRTVACELALEPHTVIANLMHRLQHPRPVENRSAVTLPLTTEPQADCHRYDRLLTGGGPPCNGMNCAPP